MLNLRFLGTATVGSDSFDRTIRDLHLVETPNGSILVSVTSRGGLASWILETGSLPTDRDVRSFSIDRVTATGPQLDAFGDGVAIGGISFGGLDLSAISSTGAVSALDTRNAGNENASVIASFGDGRVALADANGSGLSLYNQNSSGDFTLLWEKSDTDTTFADNISAMETTSLGGRDFLLTASASEYGITAFEVSGTNITARDSLGPQDGLGIMLPTALVTAQIGTATFVLLTSSASSDGTGGAISVMQLMPSGQLQPTHHVLDSRESRFGDVQGLATAQYGDFTFVATGGGDDGISLLGLLPNGRLVHLDSFADTVQSGLDGVTEIEMVVLGDTLQIFGSSDVDAGITVLEVDLRDLGSLVLANDSGQSIFGTGGSDILIDGAGRDTLQGNAGSDLFVLGNDDQTDVIREFAPSEDLLDLTGWPLLYDVADIDIRTTSTGARISARGQILVLRGSENTALDPEEVRAAIRLDISDNFYSPDLALAGGFGNELLTGSWGNDTLSGGDGNDTLKGGAGDDILIGASGTDTARFSFASDDFALVDRQGDNVTIVSAEGTDAISGVERFQFSDKTLALEELDAAIPTVLFEGSALDDTFEVMNGRDASLVGNGGNDSLRSTEGSDTLIGNSGNDTLIAGAGNDEIRTGSGNDSARGGDGQDSIIGDWGNDSLRGGNDEDSITGAGGADNISGQRHGDTISGGDGDDRVNGGGGNDFVFGNDGDDFVKGGSRHDFADGGAGNDTVVGNWFNDTLIGGAGHDRLFGGAGDDRMTGGTGDDFLNGGGGYDVFVFQEGHEMDLIVGFDVTKDTLEIDRALTGGILNTNRVVELFAEVTADGVVIDFGGGDTILLSDLSSTNGFSDALIIV